MIHAISLFIRSLLKRRLPSSYAVLPVMLSRSRLTTLLNETSDTRVLFESVAFALECTEEQLLSDIAKRLRIPFALVPQERAPESVNLELVNRFARVGAYPWFENGTLVGSYCIDPASLESTLDRALWPGLILTTWSAIREAIERVHAAHPRKQPKSQGTTPVPAVAGQILSLVVDEALSFGTQEIEIEFHQDEATYQFITSEGKRARGSIHESVAEPFSSLLGDLSRPGAPAFQHFSEASLSVGENTLPEEKIPETHAEWFVVRNEAPGKYRIIPARTALPSFIDLDKAPVETESSDKKVARPYVLVLEDSQVFSRVLERFLGSRGYLTECLSDGRHLLSFLQSQLLLPAVIVCDVHMPGIHGATIIKMLREDDRYSDIPIIMLTSDDRPETELALLTAGAHAFLPKSKDPRILCAHIERVINESNRK